MEDDTAPAFGETSLRWLKGLVMVLTATMIAGVVTIVAIFVMRFGATERVDIPAEIVLPDGARATAFTRGEGWYAIVTDADEILIFERATGVLRQRVQISFD